MEIGTVLVVSVTVMVGFPVLLAMLFHRKPELVSALRRHGRWVWVCIAVFWAGSVMDKLSGGPQTSVISIWVSVFMVIMAIVVAVFWKRFDSESNQFQKKRVA